MKKPENIPANRDRCRCPVCPLFTGCNRDRNEMIFCGAGLSKCDMDSSKMCICGTCPVFSDYDLAGGYFCLHEIE